MEKEASIRSRSTNLTGKNGSQSTTPKSNSQNVNNVLMKNGRNNQQISSQKDLEALEKIDIGFAGKSSNERHEIYMKVCEALKHNARRFRSTDKELKQLICKMVEDLELAKNELADDGQANKMNTTVTDDEVILILREDINKEIEKNRVLTLKNVELATKVHQLQEKVKESLSENENRQTEIDNLKRIANETATDCEVIETLKVCLEAEKKAIDKLKSDNKRLSDTNVRVYEANCKLEQEVVKLKEEIKLNEQRSANDTRSEDVNGVDINEKTVQMIAELQAQLNNLIPRTNHESMCGRSNRANEWPVLNNSHNHHACIDHEIRSNEHNGLTERQVNGGYKIFVKPINERVNIRNEVKNALKSISGSVKVTGIIYTKSNNAIIKTKDKEDQDFIVSKLKNYVNLSVMEQQQRVPWVQITQIPDALEKDEILQILKDKIGLNENDTEIKLIFRGKNYDTQKMVIKVNSEDYVKLMNEKEIVIQYMCCKVDNFLGILQCNNCGQYGHKAINCRNAKRCLYCGSDQHDLRGCRDTAGRRNKYCSNCDSTTHSAKDRNCPLRINLQEKQKERFTVFKW